MAISKTDPIVIIGAGVFGLSTALQLATEGYTDISVFERDDQVPGRFSAGYDINKIVRAEYEDPWYTELTLKAIAGWKTPLYAPHYHQTGFLHCVSGTGPQQATDTLNRFHATIKHHPEYAHKLISITSSTQIPRDIAWQLNGPLPGWKGYFNPLAGYAHSANALRAVYEAAAAVGVKFFLGPERGAIRELLRGGVATSPGKVTGVRTYSGQVHSCKLVVVAVGAAAGTLLPELGTQVVAKSWSIGHVRLSDDETSALRGIPVTYARDLGFLFEPDPKTNLLKICPMGGGYINTDPGTGVSLPPATLRESDGVLPKEDEERMRKLLRQALPALADRPFVQKKLCWFADTADSDFIVDFVPGSAGSVALLSGDSGHLFKMLPIVGEWVARLVKEGRQAESRWRWKAADSKENEKGKKWAGGDVSWRLGATREFAEIKPGPGARL
ncbi:NAD(P)/FAD-dependent oxidoreductase [Aspergillus homomorphus CBS 101889]|uniref:Sarcosine oxidase n=1 Tax=Aspergillus homomorphus (strain CBS 101889) TaxID=1450537 RepID=A0A395HP42_ASPHC|nr:sarcosine oxidase [Aspergillus homomorphus CBS 101889]RAL08618.1 sarcosine oxidase [Aspergillus homomorphus CBS 101889]